MDFKKTLKYFKDYSNTILFASFGPAGLFLFGGMIAAAVGDGGGVFFLMAIIVIIGGAILNTYFNKKNRINDQEYDSIARSVLTDLTPRALSRLGLDIDEVKEIAPIVFDGYSFDDCTKVKRGADGFWRSDRYRAVQLFFSENEVHIYTFSYSTTFANMSENTDVYFYKDIVSVSTSTETTTINRNNGQNGMGTQGMPHLMRSKRDRNNGQNGMGTQVQYECFKLTTTGGTSLKVSIRDSANAQRSINAMRQLLRAKKQM